LTNIDQLTNWRPIGQGAVHHGHERRTAPDGRIQGEQTHPGDQSLASIASVPLALSLAGNLTVVHPNEKTRALKNGTLKNEWNSTDPNLVFF